MMDFIKFISTDANHFIGFLLVLSGVGYFVRVMTIMILRAMTIRKHGYPPPHCDVDGDPVEVEVEVK